MDWTADHIKYEEDDDVDDIDDDDDDDDDNFTVAHSALVCFTKRINLFSSPYAAVPSKMYLLFRGNWPEMLHSCRVSQDMSALFPAV